MSSSIMLDLIMSCLPGKSSIFAVKITSLLSVLKLNIPGVYESLMFEPSATHTTDSRSKTTVTGRQ
jgi:hypothetical protein